MTIAADNLLLTTARVSTFNDQQLLTNASGFYFERDARLYLVTSGHVVLEQAGTTILSLPAGAVKSLDITGNGASTLRLDLASVQTAVGASGTLRVRHDQEDRVDYVIGENGARISREEKAALDALLNRIKEQKPHG